jgi:integrase
MARGNENKWMPPNVSKNKYSYYIKTKSNRSITLCKITASHVEVWIAYEKALAQERDKLLFKDLWGKFLGSMDFSDLAVRTQKDYLSAQKSILGVFGNTEPDKIEPKHIRNYMDIRGERSEVQANHEHACMSRVFSWGYERGLTKGNPCVGVKKYPKHIRDQYITDEEYKAIYEEAAPALQVAMEIAYLCAMRIADVLKLTWDQVSEKGILAKQRKTVVIQLKQFTPRLKRAFNHAKELYPNSRYVVCNKFGSKYSYNGMNDRWRDARQKAGVKLGHIIDGTFHDLKAKGISDYKGSSRDKQIFSGHKTESQVLVYDRKIKETPTLDTE